MHRPLGRRAAGSCAWAGRSQCRTRARCSDEDRRTGNGHQPGRGDHPLLCTRGVDFQPAHSGSNYRQYEADRCVAPGLHPPLPIAGHEPRRGASYVELPGDRHAADCGEMNAVLDEQVEHVDLRVRELKLLEKQMRELRANCNSERRGSPATSSTNSAPIGAVPTAHAACCGPGRRMCMSGLCTAGQAGRGGFERYQRSADSTGRSPPSSGLARRRQGAVRTVFERRLH